MDSAITLAISSIALKTFLYMACYDVATRARARVSLHSLEGETLEIALFVPLLHVMYDNDVTCHIAPVTV